MENGMQVMPSMPGESVPTAPPTSGLRRYLTGVDEAAGKVNTANRGLPSPVGTMEALGSMASGAVALPVGSIAGIGTEAARGLGLTNAKGEDIAERVQRFLTYRPRSESGKAKTELLGTATAPITESGADIALAPLLFAGEAGAVRVPRNASRASPGRRVSPGASGEVVEAGAPAQAVQGAATAGRAAGLESVPAAAERSSAQIARDAGFVLKPSEAGGRGGAVAEGLAGSAKLETAAIIKNSKRADQLAAEEIGVKDLKGGEFAKAREPHSAVYREVGRLGEVPAGPEYAAEISSIGRAPGNSFDKAINSEVETLKQQYTVERFNAQDAVQETRELRFKARKNLKSQDPAKNELGAAQLKVSNAIENQLERQATALGKTDLVARFKSARVELAKINSVVGAMRNGRISPEIIAKQLDAGVPLSGNLRTIAQVAKDYPNVMRNAAKVKGATPVNMFETMAGMGGLAATAAMNPLAGLPLVGAAVSRPLTRAALLSERYQNRLARRSTNALAEESVAKPKKTNALLEY